MSGDHNGRDMSPNGMLSHYQSVAAPFAFGKDKGKVHPRIVHEGPEREQMYSSTLSLTLALDGGGWSMPRPGHFTHEKETQYPLHRRLDGPQGRSGRVRTISRPPQGFDPRTVQPVASRYTD